MRFINKKTVAEKNSPQYILERKKVESDYLLTIPLWLILFAILMWGMVILYSVSAATAYIDAQTKEIIPDAAFYVRKQAGFTVVGVIAAFIISRFPIDKLKKPVLMFGIIGATVALLLATRLIGISRNGAKRWLKLGVEFQTSELLKVGAVVAYAIYRNWIIKLRTKSNEMNEKLKFGRWHFAVVDFLIPVTTLIVCDLLVLFQPHTSGFIIIGTIVFACVLCSGLSLETWFKGMLPYIVIVLVVIGAILVLPSDAAIKVKVNDYLHSHFAHVFTRIALNSEDETLSKDDTMQYDNAFAALGSGGMRGVGIGNSRSKYHYVPEAHTDYIFAIYVEETGMFGGCILIGLYMTMFYLCMRVALRAKDVFCRIIAVGYTTMIMLEAVLNISVNLQVITPTGVSLPFVSYGGTAQVIFLCAYGMIICVARSGTHNKFDLVNDSDPEFTLPPEELTEEINSEEDLEVEKVTTNEVKKTKRVAKSNPQMTNSRKMAMELEKENQNAPKSAPKGKRREARK